MSAYAERDLPERSIPCSPEVADEKLERILDLADDLQAIYNGSRVEIRVLVDAQDCSVVPNRELSDRVDLYSVRIGVKR